MASQTAPAIRMNRLKFMAEDVNWDTAGDKVAVTRTDPTDSSNTTSVYPVNASDVPLSAATQAATTYTEVDDAIAQIVAGVGNTSATDSVGSAAAVASIVGIYASRVTSQNSLFFRSFKPASPVLMVEDNAGRTTLTGSVSIVAGQTAVVGSGCAFTTQLVIGQRVKCNTEDSVVQAITDNDNMTLESNHTLGSGGAGATIERYHDELDISLDETVVYKMSGLNVDQASADTYGLKLSDSTDLTNVFSLETGIDTDEYLDVKKKHATNGGVLLRGLTNATGSVGFQFDAMIGVTNAASGAGAFIINSSKDNSSGNVASMATTEKLAAIQNNTAEQWAIDAVGKVTQQGGLTIAGALAGATTINASGLATVGTLNVATYALTVGAASTINQDVSTTGSPQFRNVTIPTGYDVTLTDAPTADTDAANKAYVDGVVNGLDWQDSIYNTADLTADRSGDGGWATGVRYIDNTGGTIHANNGGGTSVQWRIYEYNGATMDEIIPNEGHAVWHETDDNLQVFNGGVWVTFGSTTTHESLSGVDSGTYRHLTATQVTNLTDQHAQLVAATGSPSFIGLTITGNGSDITLSDDAKTITIENNAANVLQIGSSGMANLLAFDTTTGSETVDVAGDLDIASGKALKLNGTSIFATANTWTAPQTETATVLGTTGAISMDGSNGTNFTMPALTGAVTITPSNMVAGNPYTLNVIQHAGSAQTCVMGTGTGTGTMTTTLSGASQFTVVYDGATYWYTIVNFS